MLTLGDSELDQSPDCTGPDDFLVTLHRRRVDLPIFSVDIVHGTEVVVAELQEGIEKGWNRYLPDHSRSVVTPFDRLVCVNGEADLTQMLVSLHEERELKLVLRHARRVCVCVEKARRMLGMSVVLRTTRNSLEITRLDPGAVLEWNAQSEETVGVGDHIVSVNGAKEPTAMLRELSTQRVLKFVVMQLR